MAPKIDLVGRLARACRGRCRPAVEPPVSDVGRFEAEVAAAVECERRRVWDEVGGRWSGLSGDWPNRAPRQL